MVDFARALRAPPKPPPEVPWPIIGVSGHRPNKIGGYDRNNPLRRAIRARLQKEITALAKKPRPDLGTLHAHHVDNYLRQISWLRPRPVSGPLLITGLALGIDQDAAGICAREGIQFIGAIPFPGQESRWPEPAQKIYSKIISEYACGIVYVSHDAPADHTRASEMLHKRNEWICCAADELIAVWDGTHGGTSSCVRYWRKFGKMEIRINPREIAA